MSTPNPNPLDYASPKNRRQPLDRAPRPCENPHLAQGWFLLAAGPHPPLRGTFSRGEKGKRPGEGPRTASFADMDRPWQTVADPSSAFPMRITS